MKLTYKSQPFGCWLAYSPDNPKRELFFQSESDIIGLAETFGAGLECDHEKAMNFLDENEGKIIDDPCYDEVMQESFTE